VSEAVLSWIPASTGVTADWIKPGLRGRRERQSIRNCCDPQSCDSPAAEAEPPPSPALSEADVAGARSFVDASRAASTRKAYAADWRFFAAWCHARHAPTLPANPALVAVYLSVLGRRGLAPPSVGRALAAIAHAHRRPGLVAPHRGCPVQSVTNVPCCRGSNPRNF